MIGWNSPETTASWPIKRRRFGRLFWSLVMLGFVSAIIIRMLIGQDAEQPKFSPVLSIEERQPEGLYKVDGGYINAK